MGEEAIMVVLGDGLRRERLRQNLTQAALSERAGVGQRTVQNAERGEGMSVATLVALMRALGIEDRLGRLFPEPGLSPVELVKLRGRERQRATGTRGGGTVEGQGATRERGKAGGRGYRGRGEGVGEAEGDGAGKRRTARIEERGETWSWGE